MQNPFKEFLYFSRGERRGILVLITGIILVFLSGYIYIYQRENRPLSDEVIRRQATAMAEYESFIASIQEKEQKWDNRLKPSSQINPEKPDVPLNKNDAFQKVQKRRVQEKR